MRELDRALADIGAMRRELARQDSLRGDGPAAVAGTGVPAAAVARVVLVGAEALTRSQRLRCRLADAVILAAADFALAGTSWPASRRSASAAALAATPWAMVGGVR